jgi:hypothetical protein
MSATAYDQSRAEAFAGRMLDLLNGVQQKARELLAEAGFTSVDVHLLEHDPFKAYFVVRP